MKLLLGVFIGLILLSASTASHLYNDEKDLVKENDMERESSNDAREISIELYEYDYEDEEPEEYEYYEEEDVKLSLGFKQLQFLRNDNEYRS